MLSPNRWQRYYPGVSITRPISSKNSPAPNKLPQCFALLLQRECVAEWRSLRSGKRGVNNHSFLFSALWAVSFAFRRESCSSCFSLLLSEELTSGCHSQRAAILTLFVLTNAPGLNDPVSICQHLHVSPKYRKFFFSLGLKDFGISGETNEKKMGKNISVMTGPAPKAMFARDSLFEWLSHCASISKVAQLKQVCGSLGVLNVFLFWEDRKHHVPWTDSQNWATTQMEVIHVVKVWRTRWGSMGEFYLNQGGPFVHKAGELWRWGVLRVTTVAYGPIFWGEDDWPQQTILHSNPEKNTSLLTCKYIILCPSMGF